MPTLIYLVLQLSIVLHADITPLTDTEMSQSHLKTQNSVVFNTLINLKANGEDADTDFVLSSFKDSIDVNDSKTQFTLDLNRFTEQFKDPSLALDAVLLAFQDTLAVAGIYYDLEVINPEIRGNLTIQILDPSREIISNIYGVDYIERLELKNITLGSKSSPSIGDIYISEIELGPNSYIRIINRP